MSVSSSNWLNGAFASFRSATPHPLPREFFERPTLQVAKDLLGCTLVHRVGDGARIGRIVEVEAYVGRGDRACHASKGRTARTEVMFGPAGHAYVYMIYGMHHCLNVVTEREGFAAAVLLRALEPMAGMDGSASGPGRLCRAMGIDRSQNGVDLTEGELVIVQGQRPMRVGRSARIGVDYAGIWARKPWRLFDAESRYVSKLR